jgi:hypothetical protein
MDLIHMPRNKNAGHYLFMTVLEQVLASACTVPVRGVVDALKRTNQLFTPNGAIFR